MGKLTLAKLKFASIITAKKRKGKHNNYLLESIIKTQEYLKYIP